MFARRRIVDFFVVATAATCGMRDIDSWLDHRIKHSYQQRYPYDLRKSQIYTEANTQPTIEKTLIVLEKLGSDEPCTAAASGATTRRDQGKMIIRETPVDPDRLTKCVAANKKAPVSPEQYNRGMDEAARKLPIIWELEAVIGLLGAALVAVKPVEYQRFFANLRHRNAQPDGSTPT